MCSDESVSKAVQEILDTEGKIDVLCKIIYHIIIYFKILANYSKRKRAVHHWVAEN